MSNTRPRKDHGPRLAAYVRAQLAPGQSMRSFCLQHGLDNQRISVWETTSGDVSIDSMREFGDKLGLTLGQVMVIAGYGTEDEFGGATPPAPTPPPPVSVDDAIERDPELSDVERDLLRNLRAFSRGDKRGIDTVTIRASNVKRPRRAK